MSFALEQFSTVTDSDDFLRVPLPILTQYLSDDNINAAREEQIFQVGLKVPGVDIFSIFLISKSDPYWQWLKENEEARKEHAFEVLNCTRLALLAPRFLLDEVENNDFFKESRFLFNQLIW